MSRVNAKVTPTMWLFDLWWSLTYRHRKTTYDEVRTYEYVQDLGRHKAGETIETDSRAVAHMLSNEHRASKIIIISINNKKYFKRIA